MSPVGDVLRSSSVSIGMKVDRLLDKINLVDILHLKAIIAFEKK